MASTLPDAIISMTSYTGSVVDKAIAFFNDVAAGGIGGPTISVKDSAYGALGNGRRVASGGAITTGTPDLVNNTISFAPTDVGKLIVVSGAGAAGAALRTTISAYVSVHAVTLAANASTTVSNAAMLMGTDDRAALIAAFTEAATYGGTGTNAAGSATVIIPRGQYLCSTGIDLSSYASKINIVGEGMQVTHITFTNTDTDGFTATGTSPSPKSYIRFAHLTCEGPGQAIGTGNGFAMTFCNPLLRFDQVESISWGASGWKLNNCFEASFDRCFGKFNGAWGFNLDGTNDSTALMWCYAANNTTGGYRFADGWQGPAVGVWSQSDPIGILIENSVNAGSGNYALSKSPMIIGGVMEGDSSGTNNLLIRTAVATPVRNPRIQGLFCLSGGGTLAKIGGCSDADVLLTTHGSATTSAHLTVDADATDTRIIHSYLQSSSETVFTDNGTNTFRWSKDGFFTGALRAGTKSTRYTKTPGTASTGTMVNQVAYATPIVVPKATTFNLISIEQTTAGSAGRTVTDGVTTSGSAVVTSATAAFVAGDQGRLLTGSTNVPAGTTILTVDSGTQITMSANATASGTGTTIVISGVVVRLGIYDDDGSGEFPGAVHLDAGVVDLSGSNGEKTLTINTILQPGLYWTVACAQGTTSPGVRTIISESLNVLNTGPSSSSVVSYTKSNVTGALPAWGSTVAVGSFGPRVYLRRA